MDVLGKATNEKRLIDADDVYSLFDKDGFARLHVADIDTIPRVDAVEVVRCRDCKHRGTDYCIFHIKGEPADEELLRKLDNDFCSYGERKDGDGNG